MRARSKNSILLAIGAVIGFSVNYAIRGAQETRPIDNEPAAQELEETVEETYTVSRFVDGDTIDVEEGIEVLLYRIRLLGIDTPERGEPGFNEATNALESMIPNNQVTLKKDPSRDLGKYGRPLRYLFVGDTNLNVELVRQGRARAYLHEGLIYERELLEAEREAKEHQRGIWADL